MKLGEFLNKNKITTKRFARECGLSLESVRNVLYERGYLSAALAKKIHLYTNKAISIEDLVFNRCGWERCPCCSQTLSDVDKPIDYDFLDAMRECKKQIEEKRNIGG